MQTQWILREFKQRAPPLIPAYLLHGFDTGKGTSRRCQVPHRSPRRWADTGLCCPILACPLPHLSPSSPGPHETGSGHPVLGLVTSASWWLLVIFTGHRNWKKMLPLSLPLVTSCWFCYFPANLQGAVSLLIQSPLWTVSLSHCPLPLLSVQGRGTEVFILTYGT